VSISIINASPPQQRRESLNLDEEREGLDEFLVDSKSRPELRHRDELPEWLKPTPGIMGGYRVGYTKLG